MLGRRERGFFFLFFPFLKFERFLSNCVADGWSRTTFNNVKLLDYSFWWFGLWSGGKTWFMIFFFFPLKIVNVLLLGLFFSSLEFSVGFMKQLNKLHFTEEM